MKTLGSGVDVAGGQAGTGAGHHIGHGATHPERVGHDPGHPRLVGCFDRGVGQDRHRPDPQDRAGPELGGFDLHAGQQILDRAEALGGCHQRAAREGREGGFELGRGRGNVAARVDLAIRAQERNLVAAHHRHFLRARRSSRGCRRTDWQRCLARHRRGACQARCFAMGFLCDRVTGQKSGLGIKRAARGQRSVGQADSGRRLRDCQMSGRGGIKCHAFHHFLASQSCRPPPTTPKGLWFQVVFSGIN